MQTLVLKIFLLLFLAKDFKKELQQSIWVRRQLSGVKGGVLRKGGLGFEWKTDPEALKQAKREPFQLRSSAVVWVRLYRAQWKLTVWEPGHKQKCLPWESRSLDNVSIVPLLFKAAGDSGILTVYCPQLPGKLLGERFKNRQKTALKKKKKLLKMSVSDKNTADCFMYYVPLASVLGIFGRGDLCEPRVWHYFLNLHVSSAQCQLLEIAACRYLLHGYQAGAEGRKHNFW